MATIVTVCCACPDAAQRTAEATKAGQHVSHGLCPACAARIAAEEGIEL